MTGNGVACAFPPLSAVWFETDPESIKQYLKFGGERTQPSIDPANRIDLPNPSRIVDLDCGSGNSTAVLCHRWPNSRIEDLDSSEAIIISTATVFDPDAAAASAPR